MQNEEDYILVNGNMLFISEQGKFYNQDHKLIVENMDEF